jgi:hypothetical protein
MSVEQASAYAALPGQAGASVKREILLGGDETVVRGLTFEPRRYDESRLFVGAAAGGSGMGLEAATSKFPAGLPKHAACTKEFEQATIALLCDELNTPAGGDQRAPPAACKVHYNEDYTEVVVFDPMRCNTQSFKAELVVDISLAYPMSWSGWWWARCGWVETKQALELRAEQQRYRKDRARTSAWYSFRLDVVLAIVIFVAAVCLVEVTAYEMPFLYALMAVAIVLLSKARQPPWTPMSAASSAAFLLTAFWAVARFSFKVQSCGDDTSTSQTDDRFIFPLPSSSPTATPSPTFVAECRDTKVMCIKACSHSHNSFSEHCKDSDYWSQCGAEDKNMIYAMLFSLLIFLFLQLLHTGAFGDTFFSIPGSAVAPGCDADGIGGVAPFRSAPRLTITVRHVDAGSLILRQTRIVATVFHGSLDTYEALSKMIHDPSIPVRKLALLKSLSSSVELPPISPLGFNSTAFLHPQHYPPQAQTFLHDKQTIMFTALGALVSFLALVVFVVNVALLKDPLNKWGGSAYFDALFIIAYASSVAFVVLACAGLIVFALRRLG